MQDPDLDPLVRGMDPRIRIHTSMSWIQNTAVQNRKLKNVCLLQGGVHGEGGPHGHREHEEEGALGLHRSNYTEERNLIKDTMHPVFFSHLNITISSMRQKEDLHINLL